MKSIPAHGRDAATILDDLRARSARDTDWRGGRVFSLVYHAGEEHEELLRAAHATYASANLLNPMAFASLKQMENELVEMTGRLFHCAGAVGAVTSGGTESILVAVAAYRDRARRERPWIRRPELVVPTTIHPAFDKAAHYFGVRLVKVPVGPDLRADVRAMARAIGWRTIGLVASAPQYPHGLVDPIGELGELAQKKKLPLHVDACVGGFILPWLEKLGRRIPHWDFRVPGVTSISADLHKYGYAGKGASLLLWRSIDAMKYQIFVATDFPGGVYASPTMIGTRPGGPVAAAWAAMQSLGEAGYLALAEKAIGAADRLRDGIAQIPGVALVGNGSATIVAYAGGTGVDTYALADRLEARGWTVDRQHRPASIHLTVTANHAPIVDAYLADLRAAVADVQRDPALAKSGSAPMYGMAAKMPIRRLVAGQVRKMITEMYTRRDP
ncbi:MAG: aspartate aminotransferase family protein [Deltaproteobacteria bacterium]|nr:aspartate aminotransferase family protein [Deltaproteobacteria bacterium]MCW5801474.1 aspartate aminotransferase family protein [Deltaproteobacteria bacterium]